MRRIGYRRTADVTGVCVSREHMRRSLHQAVRETPSRTACIARIPAPSMRVTSGPGVPTGGSLPHAQRLRAPSSADERFDILKISRDRMRFQESVSPRCRPKIQAIFGHPPILQSARQDALDAKNFREGDRGIRRGCEGGMERAWLSQSPTRRNKRRSAQLAGIRHRRTVS